MKNHTLTAFLIAVALPASLFASSGTDGKIEDAANASFNYRTVLKDQVTVKAQDGVVTLTGTVEDSSNKELAEDTVENLPGVIRVDNEITIKPTYAEHSDAWIAFKIRSTLLIHANVSAMDTQVAVDNGVVTLTGKTQNIAQKELTEAYAKDIDNVKSVKNNLTIVAPPADESTISESIDDGSITAQVKYALFSNRATSAMKTKVETKDGIVTVSGEAASDAEISLVSKLAGDVRGVKSVSNNMTVKV